MKLITHVTDEDIARLCEAFAFRTTEGWQIPEWLKLLAAQNGIEWEER